jgi:hypothetical protein
LATKAELLYRLWCGQTFTAQIELLP